MSYSSEVLADSPLGYWRMGDTSGSTMVDSSGNGRDGTYVSSPTLGEPSLVASDTANKAVKFNGSTQYAEVPYGAWVDQPATFTLECIFKPTAIKSSGTPDILLARRSVSGGLNQSWHLQFNPSTTGGGADPSGIRFLGFDGASSNPIIDSSGVDFVAGVAYHLVVTFNAGGVLFYVNGVAQTTVGTMPAALNSSTSKLTIGAEISSGSVGAPANATIDEVAYYGTVLSPTRVLAHYNAIAAPAATTGAGTATAPTPTATGTGTSTATGAGTATAPAPTASGTGTSTVTGSGTATAPTPTASGAGTSDDTSAGSGTATAPAPTATGTGTSTATGDGTATAPTPTGSGTGVVTGTDPVGTGTATAPLPTATGTGHVDVEDCVTVEFVVEVEVEVSVTLTPVAELPGSEVILRESFQMPAITEANPVYTARVDYPVVTEALGTVHLWIGGVDVTYFRGVPTKILRWDSEAPFGDKAAAWEMPGMMPWERPGVGDFAFMRRDAEVVIGYVSPLGVVRREWVGFYDSRSRTYAERPSGIFEAKGEMWAAMHHNHEPLPYMPPTDIGIVIPRLLNAARGRRYARVREVITGIKTRIRGSRDQKLWQVVQDIFAEAWTDDGRQWTLRDGQLALKKAMTDVTATVAAGTPLVDLDITVDQSSGIDIVWARGKSKGGGEWANVYYPGLALLTPPPFPNDPVVNINIGMDDGDTDTGTGVSDWQRKVNALGRWGRLAVDGSFDLRDSRVLREIQDDLGLTVDGSLGPQSWEGTMGAGREAIDLTPLRLPMAMKPWAWPTLHDSQGRVTGPNPLYDPTRIPREVALDLGTNVSHAQGKRITKTYLAIHGEPSAVGSVEFIGDPNEIDRTLLDLGDNLNVTGVEGRDVVVQLARKSVELDGDSDGRSLIVRFDFDERARDALTIDQILERNRAALPDPARRPGNPNRQSRNVRDEGYTWDEESPCGEIERVAVNGVSGLWTTRVVPVAEFGTLASIILDSDYPFAFAVFANTRITPNVLRRLVGNPFASASPFAPNMSELEDVWGFVEAWGQQGDACGYGNTPEAKGGTFTGKFIFKNPLDYITDGLPYLTFAFYMRGGSGFVDGRARPTKDAG